MAGFNQIPLFSDKRGKTVNRYSFSIFWIMHYNILQYYSANHISDFQMLKSMIFERNTETNKQERKNILFIMDTVEEQNWLNLAKIDLLSSVFSSECFKCAN